MIEKTVEHTTNDGLKKIYNIIIDDEDNEYFEENKWSIQFDKNDNIKYLRNKKTSKLLHRILTNCPKGKYVLFKNKNNSDFRKSNLEISDHTSQQKNFKKKIIVFVDTETTGLPDKTIYGKYVTPRDKDAYRNARLISLSYIITDDNGEIIQEPKDYIIKPSGFIIPEDSAKLTGITTDIAKKKGRYVNGVIDEFECDIHKFNVTHFISHNVIFDKNILQNNALRRKWIYDSLLLHLEQNMEYECTSILTNYKKLEDCVREILKKEPNNLHKSLDDMLYCKDIYFKLTK